MTGDEADSAGHSPTHREESPAVRDPGSTQRISLSRVESFVHVGPLPTPEMLRGYEEIAKDFPERLLAMSERQAAHRIAQEVKLVEAQIEDLHADRRERRLGQLFGFSIALAGFALCGLSVALDQPDVAKWIGTGTLLGLVTVMVTGRAFAGRSGSSENESEHESRTESQPAKPGSSS